MHLALEDALSAFSALIDATDEFVVVLDRELRILWSNRIAEAILGRSAAALAGRRIEEYIVSEGREDFLRQARRMKGLRSCTVCFLSKREERRPVRFTMAPFSRASGVLRGFVVVGRRLDEEAAWRKCGDASSGLAVRMLSGFADPVFLIDGHSRKIRDCNRAALETFGFSREELLGRRLFDVLADDEGRREARRIEAEALRTYETAGVFQKRIRYPLKGGGSLPCDLMGLPFFGQDGGLETIIVILVERSAEASRDAEFARLADMVSTLAGELSAMVGDRRPEAPSARLSDMGFTPRQIEILRLSTSGASAKEIGFQLGIAESTVKNHLSVIYRKLGVKTKVGCIGAIASRRLRIE